MRFVKTLAFLAFVLFFSSTYALEKTPQKHPFPTSVNYPYGIKPSVDQQKMNADVQSAFASWLKMYVTTDGCPAKEMYRVHRYIGSGSGDPSDPNNYDYDTVSEGIAWGMLFCVLMENQTNQTKKIFDGLWKYYQYYYYKNYGLMSWRIDKNGKILGHDAATEADENTAMALLYADKQWGSSGKINYLKEAKNMISNILSYEVEQGTYVLKPGCEWGGSMIAINPCYFDTAYYTVWERFNNHWAKTNDACLKTYAYFYNKDHAGLFPDWCKADGTPAKDPLATSEPFYLDYTYSYNACQTHLKIALDYLWHGKNAKYLYKFNDWIISKTNGSPEAIKDGYTLNGTTTGRWHNACFVGPICLAAMVDSKYQPWLNKLYANLLKLETGGNWGYYPDTLRVISLLIVSGNMPNYWPVTSKPKSF